jgi:hypothetical protein
LLEDGSAVVLWRSIDLLQWQLDDGEALFHFEMILFNVHFMFCMYPKLRHFQFWRRNVQGELIHYYLNFIPVKNSN